MSLLDKLREFGPRVIENGKSRPMTEGEFIGQHDRIMTALTKMPFQADANRLRIRGNARQSRRYRRQQVKEWKAKGLNFIPFHPLLPWEIEELQEKRAARKLMGWQKKMRRRHRDYYGK